jgi:hypothetical protein
MLFFTLPIIIETKEEHHGIYFSRINIESTPESSFGLELAKSEFLYFKVLISNLL